MDLNASMLAVLVGMLGIFFGTLISPYINHKLTQRYNREDLFFKKKLEYFEGITECIEKNIKLYRNSINKAEQNNQEIKEIIENIKKERKKFLISSSPIYLNTLNLSESIKGFTKTEGKIFIAFENLDDNLKNKEIKIEDLKEQLNFLKKSANRIIFEMKKEIKNAI